MTPKHDSALAINGGVPVRSDPMPPRFALGDEERNKVLEVMDYYRQKDLDPGYQGHFEEMYCKAFSDYMGGGFADAVATGTASVFITIAALELPRGSEILVSPITDPGSLSAIIMNGMIPKLIDSCPGSYNIGLDQVNERITPNTKALLIVHAAGQGIQDTANIVKDCHKQGIKVIEDCSQAHGAKVDGHMVGSFGDIAAFSTMYRKAHMTGASGGLVFSRNEKLYHSALAHADRGKARWVDGFDDRNPNTFLFPALNFHTDEISCGIGISSLARLSDSKLRRNAYVSGVVEGLKQQSRACSPLAWGKDDSPFYFPIIVDVERISCSVEEFANAIKNEGIPLNSHYEYVVSEWPWVKSYLSDNSTTPNALKTREMTFCLYLNENYGPKEVEDTLAAIYKVEDSFQR